MAEEASSPEEGTSTAGTAGDPAGKKLGKKQVKNEHVLIIVGVITLILTFYYMRKQSAAAAASTQAATTAPAQQSPYGYASNPYSQYGYAGSSGTGVDYSSDFSGLAQDLATISSEIEGLTPVTSGTPPVSTTTTPPVTTTPTAPAVNFDTTPLSDQNQHGVGYSIGQSGYSGGILQGLDGSYYSAISTLATTQQLAEQGVQTYYEPSIGQFQPIQGGVSGVNTLETGAGAGTTTYQKVG